MSLSQAQVQERLTGAWDWWSGEIMAMLPRQARTGRNRMAYVRLRPDAVIIERQIGDVLETHADNRPLAELDAGAWDEILSLTRGLNTAIVLDPPSGWVAETVLPRAARTRMTSAIELQIAHLSPVPPDQICWQAHALQTLNDEFSVAIPMGKLEHIAQIRDLFETHGRPMPPIYVPHDGHFLSLVAGKALVRDRAAIRDRRLWAGAAIAIAAIPFLIWGGAVGLEAHTRQQIADAQIRLDPVLAAESKWRREEDIRKGMSRLAAISRVSDLLYGLETHLPAHTVPELLAVEADGRFTIVLEASDAESILTALAEDDQFSSLRVVQEQPVADDRYRFTLRTRG